VIDVVVPKWGLTMEDAEVLQWLKSVGDAVSEGEPILELETDKATGEVESPATGVLAEALVEPGQVVEPGQLLGRIAEAQ
jgi:pyruvate/2-oxoglutarate dehydrogenase complex dihydrolipoamide acyltransferase (E2) component